MKLTLSVAFNCRVAVHRGSRISIRHSELKVLNYVGGYLQPDVCFNIMHCIALCHRDCVQFAENHEVGTIVNGSRLNKYWPLFVSWLKSILLY